MPMVLNLGDDVEPVTSLPIKFENKYGSYDRDMLTMPIDTLKAYLQAGAQHVHGSVVAAAVASDIRSKIAGKNGKVTEVSKDAVHGWRIAHPDEVKALEAAAYNASVASADAGELGRRQRESGPRLDPVEREFRNLVLIRATALCEGIGVKLPAARSTNGEAPSFKMADGNVFTRAQFLERVATSVKHGPELRKQAERTVTARTRVAQQAKTDGSSATAESMF